MFRGRHEHTMDPKGRLSIPVGWRESLSGDPAPVVTTHQGCLRLYPRPAWEEVEARLDGLPSLDPDAQEYKFFVLSGADDCPLDKQGRILLPPPLRQHAALDRDVVLAGVGERIEIWNRTRFYDRIEETHKRLPEIERRLGGGSGGAQDSA